MQNISYNLVYADTNLSDNPVSAEWHTSQSLAEKGNIFHNVATAEKKFTHVQPWHNNLGSALS